LELRNQTAHTWAANKKEAWVQKFYLLIISLLALNAYSSEIKHSFIAGGLNSLDIGYDLKISTSHISFLTNTSMDFSKITNNEWSQKVKEISWNLTTLYGKDFLITNGLSLRPAIGLKYIMDYDHFKASWSNPDDVDEYSTTKTTFLFLARLSFLKQFEHIFTGIYSDITSIDISNQVRKFIGGDRADDSEYRINLSLRPQFLFGYMF
jgi:hypothetical protein